MDIDIVKLTQDLVRIPSTTGDESQIAEFIKEVIKPFFDFVEIDEIGNVVGKIIFDKKRPTVLFNGHMDTVDPGEMEEPYSGKIVDGSQFGITGEVVYGRGSADMKGAIAAYIGAISQLKTIDDPPNVIFHAVVQEEPARGEGTKFAMDHLDIKPDVALSGEPTNLDICLGFRGWVQFELETFGKTAHGSNPSRGINAILLMRDFLNALDGYIRKLESKVHPFLGKATCAVTNIKCSPGRLSVIPDRCCLTFDSRYFPEESAQDRKNELLFLLEELRKKNPEFKAKLRIISQGMRPTLVSPQNKYVQIMKKAVLKVTKKEPKLKSWLFTCDSSYLVNDYSIPTVGFGPSESVVHTPEEHVPVEHLKVAECVYKEFLALLHK